MLCYNISCRYLYRAILRLIQQIFYNLTSQDLLVNYILNINYTEYLCLFYEKSIL